MNSTRTRMRPEEALVDLSDIRPAARDSADRIMENSFGGPDLLHRRDVALVEGGIECVHGEEDRPFGPRPSSLGRAPGTVSLPFR
jgi:hypothetical protein